MWVRAKEPGFVGGIYRDKDSTFLWPDGLRLGKGVEEAGEAPADAPPEPVAAAAPVDPEPIPDPRTFHEAQRRGRKG